MVASRDPLERHLSVDLPRRHNQTKQAGPRALQLKIIAFAGPARAGKSKAADIVEDLCKADHTVVRESFAKPMRLAWKRLASYLTAKTGEPVNRDTKPELYRSTMQRWGESRRAEDPNHWCIRMAERLGRLKKAELLAYTVVDDAKDWRETLVLIDDVRYVNEVVLMHSCNAQVIFVDPKGRVDLSESWRRHESEALANGYINGQFDDGLFDRVVVNSRSEKAFRYKIKGAVNDWLREAVT